MPIILQPDLFSDFEPERNFESLGKAFFDASKFNLTRSMPVWRNIHQHNINSSLKINNSLCQKDYFGYPLKKLKIQSQERDFYQTLEARHKCDEKKIGPGEVSFAAISRILHYSYGNRENSQKRYAPSGGGLYPSEVYLLVLRVEELEPGLYHYDVTKQGLSKIRAGVLTKELAECFPEPAPMENIIQNSSCFLILTSCVQRTFDKYWLRGWRLAFLDAGHLSQNLWLNMAAEDLAVCPLFNCLDNAIINFLGAPSNEIFINCFRVGREKL